ncbi:hypothetical protein EVG20_g6308 [Dentipellis fragilis]|uniref:Uncharacterized protein n=1 Tax=Dentipellis fragilis TaxID=205917 RepID=A0A4Y9YQY6_9AGAM|nr:hypothetical protein EVG20_g6308 [Dentipellis fragilis]
MLVSSTLGSRAQGVLSEGEVMLLKYGSKRMLVEVPSDYEDLVNLTRDVFAVEHGKVVFETADLDICAGETAEIHHRVWSSICNVVGIVNVSVRSLDSPRYAPAPLDAFHEDVGKENICPSGARPSLKESGSASSRSAAASKRVLSPREESSQDYDKLADEMENIPNSDELDDQLDEDKEYYDEQPASPTKGKGKGRTRNQIMSDDEEEEQDEEQVEEQVLAPSSSKNTAFNTASPAAFRFSTERDVKGFSSPKVKASPRDVDDLFSPKEKSKPQKSSSLRKGVEEEDETEEEHVSSPKRPEEGVKLLFKERLQSTSSSTKTTEQMIKSITASSSTSSPRKDTYVKNSFKASYTETKSEATASPKPATSKFKPAVRASASREPSVASRAAEEPAAPASKKHAASEEKPGPDEKIFVTISHPPSGAESKFKFKGKHAVGRVLLSACQAFHLETEGAKLMLLDDEYLEDGIEMTSELLNHDTMHQAGVVSGNHLHISLATDQ